MHYIIRKYHFRAWFCLLFFFYKEEKKMCFKIEKCLMYFLVLRFELTCYGKTDILENDLTSELQFPIYYSQCNFFLSTFSPSLSFFKLLSPIKMKMPVSSSLFLPFTSQCPGKSCSPFVNEQFWIAHYIWKIEICSGSEWWESSTAATICFIMVAAQEEYLLFLSSPIPFDSPASIIYSPSLSLDV